MANVDAQRDGHSRGSAEGATGTCRDAIDERGPNRMELPRSGLRRVICCSSIRRANDW